MKKNMQKSSKTRIKFGTNLTPAQKKKNKKTSSLRNCHFHFRKKGYFT